MDLIGRYVVVATILASAATFVHASIIVVDISSGSSWFVTNSTDLEGVPSVVPGGIYSDLRRAGIIGDPYFRFNDVEYRWVALANWTYYSTFTVPEEVLSKRNIRLLGAGLDNAAQVFLNGELVAFSDNMFVWNSWDISKQIKVSDNNITVAFTSPIAYAADRHMAYVSKFNYDVPPSCPSPVQNGECHVNFLRKIQSSFSWDWGPAFPSVGIWKPLKIQAFDTCVMTDVTVQTIQDGSRWTLNLTLHFDCANTKGEIDGVVNVEFHSWSTNSSIQLKTSQSTDTTVNVAFQLPLDMQLERWWPNGFGNQTLYDLKLAVSLNQSEESSKILRIGFRTVELVQEALQNASGLTFYFRVNSVPIFLKGSNWIPADSFQERITPEYLRSLLSSAQKANMNVLRVWGGGLYESDEFYELADQLGILIWQDMMFACAMYESDEHYLNSVSKEVAQQIRRLQHHPSILIWAGNNENEAALSGDWYGTSSNFSLYKSDYVALYVSTIKSVVEAEDQSRPYITSSPTNGQESIDEGYVARNPYDELYGDVHVYDYSCDSWNWTCYPRPRLASEYGFQSWPSFSTLSQVSEEQDWDYNSDFMAHRQHHLLGNMEILIGIRRHMNLPKGCDEPAAKSFDKLSKFANEQFLISVSEPECDSVEGFKGILYQTQIYQAMSVKTESEHYRRARTELIGDKGMTMGALYWQLNDVWQGASWASLEYGGKWKMLHYYAVRFFAPILISPLLIDHDDGVSLRVYGINDLPDDVTDVVLNVSVFAWNNLKPRGTDVKQVTLANLSALPVYEASLQNELTKAGCEPNECFLHFNLTDTNGAKVGPDNFALLGLFTDAVGLQKAKIKVESVDTDHDDFYRFYVVLSTDNIAPFVWLETTDIAGHFSDNGFLMVDPCLRIEFHAWQNVTADQLAASLNVTSLLDFY